MKCPACHRALRRQTVAEVAVDVCSDGCGGLWFDQGELQKFDESNENAGEALLDIPRTLGVNVDRAQRYRCTNCPDSVMMRHFFSAKRGVVVDECPTCAGVWLDPGELGKIRSEYPTEIARRQAAKAYMHEVLGDKLAAQKTETAERLARARRFANMFRFISPSDTRDKQDGGESSTE